MECLTAYALLGATAVDPTVDTANTGHIGEQYAAACLRS
jgi:hypothetical protein